MICGILCAPMKNRKLLVRMIRVVTIFSLCFLNIGVGVVRAAAPEAGGNTTVVSPIDESPVSINEDAVQPESSNIRLIVPNLVDPEGGAPSAIRIISVTGGTLWTGDGSSIGLGTAGTTLSLNTDTIDFRFRPDAGRDTDAFFVYVVVDPHDGAVNSPSSTVTIPITAVNDAPVLQTLSGPTGIGLSATYYINEWDLTGPTYQRIDSTVNFENNFGVPGLDVENFSVRWTGQVKAPVSGEFIFTTYSDDGVRLWIDGELVLDNWTLHGTTLDYATPVTFEADSMHDIRFEFYERGGGEVAILQWQYPGQGMTVIPQASLFPAVTRPEMQYVTGSGGVIIDDAVTITDVDSDEIVSSTIAITDNYESEEDSLIFINQNGISGTFVSGVLYLTGTSTLANYQAALRSVRYMNSSTEPVSDSRMVEFVVFDGYDESNATFRSIGFTDINNPPEITEGGEVEVTMDMNADPVPFSLTLNATDPDYHSISWSVSGAASHGTVSSTGVGDSITVTYIPVEDYSGEDSFVVEASDGIGGTDTILVTVLIEEHVAPIITNVAAVTGATTATISWNTNESASSRVYYTITPTSSYMSTNEINTSTRVYTHGSPVSSLISCTTYYYKVESRDRWGNVSTSTDADGVFMTSGCTGQASVSAATSTPITTASGGSTGLSEQNSAIQFTFPANITTSSDSVVIQVHALSGTQALSATGMPFTRAEKVGPVVFDAKAIINGTTVLDSFDAPVTITYTYSDADILGLRETTLALYHYHNSSWQKLENCTTDTAANTISCTSNSFSIFGLFGQPVSSGSTFTPPSIPKITRATTSTGALEINTGAAETSERSVTLSVSATNAVEMAISEDPKFENATFVQFANSYPYTLSATPGMKTVYVKLRSGDGGTLVISDTITLTETSVVVSPPTLACAVEVYLHNPVKFGTTNNPDDVRLLEKFLNTYEGTQLPINGIYEKIDVDAVIRWQEKNAADVLAPWGIFKGTGYIYTTSLAKIKQIHEGSCNGSTRESTATRREGGSAACLRTEQTLTYGMTNDSVRMAQTLLTKASYFSHIPTAFFGPLTRDAVLRFQKAQGIEQVGYIGPATRAALNAAACN